MPHLNPSNHQAIPPRWDAELCRYVHDDGEDEERRILGDGESIRVPLSLMDSMQRSVYESAGHLVYDSFGRLDRSGADPSTLSASEQAYAERGADLRDAWKGPPDHAQDLNDLCRPGYASSFRDDHAPDAETAWREQGERIRNAWKRG